MEANNKVLISTKMITNKTKILLNSKIINRN